jgi:hypothetical protein
MKKKTPNAQRPTPNIERFADGPWITELPNSEYGIGRKRQCDRFCNEEENAERPRSNGSQMRLGD